MTSGKYPDDFEFITAMQNAKARAEDLDRFNRAQAGLETGDGNRHNNKDKDKALIAGRRSSDLTQLTALDRALEDPAYAQAYWELVDTLNKYESATSAVISQEQADIAEMEADAGRLPDGTIVFKDGNGDVFTADGKRIDPDTAAGVRWPKNAPSWEEYQQRKKELEELRRYQIDVIGRVRDRINDPENPPSKDDLERWREELQKKAPQILRREVDSAPESPDLSATDKKFDVEGPPI